MQECLEKNKTVKLRWKLRG